MGLGIYDPVEYFKRDHYNDLRRSQDMETYYGQGGLGQLLGMRGLDCAAQQQAHYAALRQQEDFPTRAESKTEPIKRELTIREELQEDIDGWLEGTL